MRIAFDLDNTITNTEELYHIYFDKYLKDKNLTEKDININLIEEFQHQYLEDVFNNVSIKEDASKYLNLLSKDHDIYIITARNNKYVTLEDINIICKRWLENNDISPKKIITDASLEQKMEACKENNIEIFIDDDLRNIVHVDKLNIKTILFDDSNYYPKTKRVTNWEELYNEITKV